MKNLNSATGPQGQAQSSSSNLFSIVNFLSLFLMLGLWLHTPLVKGQVHFEPPLAPEFLGGSPTALNSGTEFLVYQNEFLIGNVYDGNTPEVYFNWSFAITSNFPLGVDINTSNLIVIDVEDPDISGYVDQAAGEARFLIVYEGLDSVTNAKHIWFELYRFDGVTFNQIIPPSFLTDSCTQGCYSANVDVEIGGNAAIVYNFGGRIYVKTTNLDVPGAIPTHLNPFVGTSMNGSAVCAGCTHVNSPGWVDVSITSEVNGQYYIHITNLDNPSGSGYWNNISVKYGEYGQIHLQSQMGAALVLGTHILRECLVNSAHGTSLGYDRPRISVQGNGFSPAAPPVAEKYAVVYTDVHPFEENIIMLSVGDVAACHISYEDAVNIHTSTNRCFNGDPVVTYFEDNHSILVAWQFNDCDDCVNADMDCPPPATHTSNENTILAKHYTSSGTRYFGNLISVVDWPYNGLRNSNAPSIAAKNFNYNLYSGVPEILFGYNSVGNAHYLNKIAQWVGAPALRPDKGDITFVEELESLGHISLLRNIIRNNEDLQLFVDGKLELTAFDILDIQGKSVINQSLQYTQEEGENILSLNTSFSNLKSGIYLLRIFGSNEANTFKFIVQ